MFDRFSAHIENEKFFRGKARIILAASAGVDSMSLFDLLKRCDIEFEVAHFDHLTRKGASTKEALFVEDLCLKNGIKFHKASFNNNKTFNNFQEEARVQRYSFFKSLHYDCLLTAHHKDDDAETIIMNFIRGKSINGIIAAQNGIVRPLLPFTKKEILQYAEDQCLEFMEDSSNKDDHYLRNFLRNQVVPLLEQKVDRFTDRVIGLSHERRERDKLLKSLTGNFLDAHYSEENVCIPIKGLKKDESTAPYILYVFLEDYGFSKTQASDIFRCIDSPGKIFNSKTHRLLVDRKTLILESYEQSDIDTQVTIDLHNLPERTVFNGYSFSFKKIDEFTEEAGKKSFSYPLSALGDTIIIRTWEKGDRFFPSGMEMKSKSIKKFYTDLKMNRFTKSRYPLLCSEDGQIMWVCGIRKDERFLQTELSGPYLLIQFE